MNRRAFIKSSGISMFGIGAAPLWLARSLEASTAGGRKKTLVTIFQRGAVDGLNVVVPFAEQRYYDLRPGIAVKKPSAESADTAIDLDGFFGLHPVLSGLAPIYKDGHLAVIHAAGSPDPTRSHFDAQDFMESGTPGLKSTRDGWLNRSLPASNGKASPVRAVSLGQNLARSIRGANAAVAVNTIDDFQVKDPSAAMGFESMYAAAGDTKLSGAGRDTFEAVRLLESLRKESYVPANGSRYPGTRFGSSMKEIARLIKANVGVEVAFADLGGWDTHVNQVGAGVRQGQFANLLTDFGSTLAAFYQDLGARMEDVVLVTMSEFGRTAKENGNRGTDHGHANMMFVMGGPVRGGKVYGDWPGLAPEQLYESRDLAVTTDFRDVLGELVNRHLGTPELAKVFPGYSASTAKFRGVLGLERPGRQLAMQ